VPKLVRGFSKTRPHSFEHKIHDVKVEIVTPELLKGRLPKAIVRNVVHTAVTHSGMKVASVEALVVMKLYAARARDEGDIAELLKEYPDINVNTWPLRDTQKALLKKLKKRAKKENAFMEGACV
jgi:hypothetical protein